MNEISINGRLIDARHIEHIDQARRYTVKQAAELLGCSAKLVYNKLVCKDQSSPHVDARHTEDFSKRSYNTKELAELLNVHRDQVYKLRMYGFLEQSPLHKAIRIPAWSIRDLLDGCAMRNRLSGISFLSIPTNTIRIPGWALAEYVASRCSEI